MLGRSWVTLAAGLIPSEAAQQRSRGIVLVPQEGLSTGRSRFLICPRRGHPFAYGFARNDLLFPRRDDELTPVRPAA